MSLSNFKNSIASRGGLAKPTAFEIILPTNNLSDFDMQSTRMGETLNLLCNATTLPGDQIVTNDRSIGLKPELMPYTYSQPDIQLTFYLTNDYLVKRYFDNWKAKIINDDGTLNFKDNFASNVDIYQLNQAVPWSKTENNNRGYVYGVKLYEAFPTTITEIQLNAASQNAIVELNVQLSYSKWERIDISNPQLKPRKLPSVTVHMPEIFESMQNLIDAENAGVSFGGFNPNAPVPGQTYYSDEELDKLIFKKSNEDEPSGPGGNGGV